MAVVDKYELFLFDLDGLLVNTEEFHFRAYCKMCEDRGFTLPWTFIRYCQAAHYSQEFLRQQIYDALPALKVQEPHFEVLYEEKKKALTHLYKTEKIAVMPGVELLLAELNTRKIKHAVVTHSSEVQISLIRNQIPQIDAIPYWWTRENYTEPKPHPECYQKAIEHLAGPKEHVIGFEDSPRGIQALLGTRAQPVLVSKVPYPEIPSLIQSGVIHFPTFLEYLNQH